MNFNNKYCNHLEYFLFDFAEMKEKHDYMQNFCIDNDEDIARTLSMFCGFTEGVQLFASFEILMNSPHFNKMKGMGQIVTCSIHDESLHCEGIIKMFHTFCQERQCLTKVVKEDIADVCQTTSGSRTISLTSPSKWAHSSE